MPNKRVGRRIYHKVEGKWKLKQECSSVSNAKAALKLLQGVAHGWKPTGRKRRRRKR